MKDAPPLSSRKQFLQNLERRVYPVVSHGTAAFVAVVFMVLTDKFLHLALGPDARIYNVMPVSFLPQTVHVVVFVRFAISAWRDRR